ncbi:MAG: bifunctional diguanylate cyclase/phosphodiesterase [Solirubrobacteraceae bacterium]|nr:bifunctional diguanylate cyclase/phosphodiesterase [Solirubrobacteraceae bacterium]
MLDPARLDALRELDLLESAPQDSLSKLNDIASAVLGVPVSALSLISWDRQITAGMNGLIGTTEVLDTPFSHSFCHHVVRAGEPFVVEDSRKHPLVMDNLAVRDDEIIAYAGVPVRLENGECVGAFCACDHKPRRWTDADLATLGNLATIAVDVLELHRIKRDGGMRDTLTGLPRRALFTERVRSMLDSDEFAMGSVTVVAVDLQAFRLFNEAWGHEAGDKILTEVARRFRDTTGDPEAVCRVAGDEFLIANAGPEDAESFVGRLQQMLASPQIRIDGVDQPVSALFVATTSKPGVDAAELIDDALATLAATKTTATEQAIGPLAGPAMERLRLRNAISGAERRDELALHYQPLLDLQTGRVHSLEALLRWEHPELGSVSPVDFIPVAETTGAIVPIGEWVLRRACSDLANWRAEFPDIDVTVAVNVAPEQVRLPSFDAAVGAALDAAGLPPGALALEITERTILTDRPGERRTIDALQARGVDLHLDDFGTGYSSLGYLTRFPLDVIKIDRMFVSRIGTDERATALIAGIIAMAHSLGLQTVAEGIEDATQRDALTEMGCDFGQGFLFARPSPGDDVPDLLRQFGG